MSPAKSSSMSDAALLRAVVADAPIVLFALDAEGKFTLSEGRGLDALGLKAGEVVGRSVFEVYGDNPTVLEHCRRALAGEAHTGVVSAGGVVFSTRYTPLLDWGGKVVGAMGVATEVTDAYRTALARDEFLSTISHELKTPLAAAWGWAHMLQDEDLTPEETEKAVSTILRNLGELKDQLAALRDASQAATGRLALKLAACDLAVAVRDAAKAVAPAAASRGVVLDLRAPALKAVADKARVRQVAFALLSNAVKFSPRGGTVTVRLEDSGSEAVLSIADEGPGLPQSLLASVFDLPRAPADDAPPRGRGLGLGLPVARRLLELHGGSVAALNREGGGALFIARLPRGRH